ITHAITAKTSKLSSEGESGALNESFSDVMAASAEEWFNETRDPVQNLVIGENWKRDGKGIRNMVDPTLHGHPDHMRNGRFCKPIASCEIHAMAGVPNRAFSLMTVGGTNQTSGVSVAKGIGWKAAREIWFGTLTNLTPQSTFTIAALAQFTVAWARGADVPRAVGCAWHAVGVLELNAAFDPRLATLVCPPAASAPPPAKSGIVESQGCMGRGDVVLCDDKEPSSATVCKNGGVVGTMVCADTAMRCKRVSPSDPTAVLDADGELACE
ncbi:MAG: M4 family metallopeptidase, partial [Labilithrix sp.]|nr:M4 family metallopeptidase [Labilithrix sp.]